VSTPVNRLSIGYTCNVRDVSTNADERYKEWEPEWSTRKVPLRRSPDSPNMQW